MRRSLEAAGGEVRTGCEVRRIVVSGERTAGVVLADGEEINAGRRVLDDLGRTLGRAPRIRLPSVR